jgi:hypothetical protein
MGVIRMMNHRKNGSCNLQKSRIGSSFLLPLFVFFMSLAPTPAHAVDWGSALSRGITAVARGVRGGLDATSVLINAAIATVGGVFDSLGLGWLFNRIINQLFGIGTCGEVMNDGVGRVICNVVISSTMIPGLIGGIAYLAGITLAIIALFKLKDHVNNPQQTPLSDAVKRFIAGGAFLAMPTVINAVVETVVGQGGNRIKAYDQTGFSGQLSSGYGLDTMVYILVADIWEPLQILLSSFAYLAGLVFVMIGISRLMKTAQEGPRGPAGVGTIMTFVTAGVLFSLDRIMGAFSQSLFASNVITTYGMLQTSTGFRPTDYHIEGMISAVIGFMALVGWISFIRGFFILRDVAEGNGQASLMAASTHIFGGALAVNLGPLLNAVQSTFGLLPFGVLFG